MRTSTCNTFMLVMQDMMRKRFVLLLGWQHHVVYYLDGPVQDKQAVQPCKVVPPDSAARHALTYAHQQQQQQRQQQQQQQRQPQQVPVRYQAPPAVADDHALYKGVIGDITAAALLQVTQQ